MCRKLEGSSAASVYFCVQYTSYKVLSSHSLLDHSQLSTCPQTPNLSVQRLYCVTTWGFFICKAEDTRSLINTDSVILWMCADVFHTASRNDAHLEGCVPSKESDRNQRTTWKKRGLGLGLETQITCLLGVVKCQSVYVSHPPMNITRTQMHQASLPGWYDTFVAPTWSQYGQRATPGTSSRDVSVMVADCDWFTVTGWVCTLLTDVLSPTEIQSEESRWLFWPAHIR